MPKTQVITLHFITSPVAKQIKFKQYMYLQF